MEWLYLLFDSSLRLAGTHPAIVQDTLYRNGLSAIGLFWGAYKLANIHAKQRSSSNRIHIIEQYLGLIPIMIYSQTDPKWSKLKLGSSSLTVGSYGCLMTAHNIALYLAGYTDITPDILAKNTRLFTDDKYPAGEGLWLWNLALPGFRYDPNGVYEFVQVLINKKSQHWVLKVGDVYYDPLTAISGTLKANYYPTGKSKRASIDPAPTPEPTKVEVTEWTEYGAVKTVKVQGTNGLGLRLRKATEPIGTGEIIKKLEDNHTYYIKGHVTNGVGHWYISSNGNVFSAEFTNQPNP